MIASVVPVAAVDLGVAVVLGEQLGWRTLVEQLGWRTLWERR